METIILAIREQLEKGYRELPKKKRTRESDKLIEDLKRIIDETDATSVRARQQINNVLSRSEGDLYSTLEQLETLYGEIAIPALKKRKVSESSLVATGQGEEAGTSATCGGGGEPASTTDQDDGDVAWQVAQDESKSMAVRFQSAVETIGKLRKLLSEEDKVGSLTRRIDQLERQNSALYIGAVVSRINNYLAPLTIESLTEEVANDPNVNATVETIVRTAQQQFRNAKKKTPLDAFRAVAGKARRDRNEMAHSEEVDVDTIKRACSGRATDLLLLNVLLSVANDKQFPLRTSAQEEEY